MHKHLRHTTFSMITGFFLGFFYIAGNLLETYDTLNFTSATFYIQWFFASIFCAVILYLLWKLPNTLTKFQWQEHSRLLKLINIVDLHLPIWGYMLIMLVCWLPTWLSIFPGAFTYDAYDEWQQICTGNLTAHHPVLHVLLLGGLTEGIYQLTGSYNLGIAIYTLLQMLFVSWAFGYTLNFLREKKVCGTLRLFALFFYCLSPVIALFSVCATKDIIFSAGMLLFMIFTYQLLQTPDTFLQTRKLKIMFVFTALVTMIFRNNGLYIVLLTLITIGFFLKKHIKKYFTLFAATLVLYLCLNVGLNNLLQVSPGGVEEMLSVPIQQLARVHHYEKDSLSTEDLELLYSILPKENLDAYRVSVSDFVKCGFNSDAFEQHKADFFKLWIQQGVKHPFTYINSFLLGTVDFWYPHAVMDGYRDVYNQSSYYDYKVSEPGTEVVLLPALHELYEYISWDKEAQKIPGIFLILSPGWFFVIFLTAFMYLWMKRFYTELIVMMIIAWNMATVFLGPIALIRYVLILFYAFPLFFLFVREKQNHITAEN